MLSQLTTIWRAMRPPFLLLPLVLMLLVMMTASYDGFVWSPYLMALIAISAVIAHASVNLLNEAEDASSGLDDRTERTPFSGGSGALQTHPKHWSRVAGFGYFCLGTLLSLGLFFIHLRGLAVFYFGILGIFLIVAYSRFITRSPGFSLIAPGLAFGPIMMVGSYYVLTGVVSITIIGLSLLVFIWVNNLLLLNQFPDVEADRSVGRYNRVIAKGTASCSELFRAALLLSYLGLAVLIWLGRLPVESLLGFLTLTLAWPLQVGVKNHYNELQQTPSLLALNVAVVLLTPALIALGLFWAMQ
ncbi:prenyltransferase [Hydrogenovibrio sp. SC-1]|uniref:prenyltransferase n=1 Tax=Hydrogenovibrio sp. SC-1 TaxID=2065820 RepID=UPI000C79C849|nr:prenyltransferase [Hydrogenovibrio sp. SC-1]PLA73807.1 prenyltransferase [Hydrogenovibrio sp. SC-1]